MQVKTILLVEDNPDDEALTRRAFSRHKIAHRVVVARDGAEALEYLAGAGRGDRVMPSLVLLDLKLPKVGGFEVLRRIRSNQQTRALPVVVLTSSKEERDLVASYDLGCNSYIRKPVNFDTFLEAVETLGLYWLLLNEDPRSEKGRG